jgi:hypothetical protein
MGKGGIGQAGVLGGMLLCLGVSAVACSSEVQQQKGSGTTGASSSSSTTTSTSSSGQGGAGGGGTSSAGGGSQGGGGGNGMPSDMYPAPHAKPPQVANYGGPVLKSPKIQPIFFSNDDAASVASLTDFVNKVGPTKYWEANTTEYGVGAATALPVVNLTETISGVITDGDVQSWLSAKLNGDDPAFAKGDSDTLYAIFYPAGLTISEGGAQSCQSFGGYHSNITLDAAHGNQHIAYAVIPRCDSFGDLMGLDGVTGAASHEFLEAATDPYPMVQPAYAAVDDKHIYWMRLLGGGETGDMCAQFPGVFTKFAELPYVVQRSWSNKAALAGHDPCVPALPGTTYFNAAPVMNDTVTYNFQGQNVPVTGVKIGVGETKTIDVNLFSDGPMDAWNVKADDIAKLFGQQAHLDVSLDNDQGQNGQTLHLTIKVLTAGKHNQELFAVVSTSGKQQNFWVGVVGN